MECLLRILGGRCLDILPMAISKVTDYADRHRLNIYARQEKCYPGCCFDGIVMSRFLDRGLGDAIIGYPKPDGLLFYWTFRFTGADHTNTPDYRLAETRD